MIIRTHSKLSKWFIVGIEEKMEWRWKQSVWVFKVYFTYSKFESFTMKKDLCIFV